ncbi:Type 1 glutamine amidotransferase-like domain-containing protein [Enterococcus sp. AZ109]|uniref:Type 1 glutamine amidotransferase-like domain-containing protein n=1 Tax=Enterococcus sp. AZ109 TaxID=2774634 RepID=UPI003F29CC07
MKKMLLVSMFQNVEDLLKKVEPILKNKTITYIPTASKVEKLGFFVKIGKWRLKKLGLIIEELEISTASYETIKSTLEKNDYIYVTGGNTFYLLQELKRSGADQLIVEQVNQGKLYIGESAGAIVVAPNIEYSKPMDDPSKAPELVDCSGLNLISAYVVPHNQNREFKKAVATIVEEYGEQHNLVVINDHQGILVDDENVAILNKK